MPRSAQPAPQPARYRIVGVQVGPFVQGQIVTADELEAAGLDVARQIRHGLIDLVVDEAVAEPEA